VAVRGDIGVVGFGSGAADDLDRVAQRNQVIA
jgi:hypothetical protein